MQKSIYSILINFERRRKRRNNTGAQRILIIEGFWSSSTTEKVVALYSQSKTVPKIAEDLFVSDFHILGQTRVRVEMTDRRMQ